MLRKLHKIFMLQQVEMQQLLWINRMREILCLIVGGDVLNLSQSWTWMVIWKIENILTWICNNSWCVRCMLGTFDLCDLWTLKSLTVGGFKGGWENLHSCSSVCQKFFSYAFAACRWKENFGVASFCVEKISKKLSYCSLSF